MTVCPVSVHEALKHSDRWPTLRLLGVQLVDADESGPAERYEVRNCACGSTLYKEIR